MIADQSNMLINLKNKLTEKLETTYILLIYHYTVLVYVFLKFLYRGTRAG